MFKRCTEQTRRAIFYACYEATLRDAPLISAPYFVLGIQREGFSPCVRDKELREQLKGFAGVLELPAQVHSKVDPRNAKDLRLDDDAKKALAWAMREADHDGSKRIETEHLMRGLLCFENTTAGALKSGGFDLETLRSASNAGSKSERLARRFRWHAMRFLRDSIWPAFWRLAALCAATMLGILCLQMLGVW